VAGGCVGLAGWQLAISMLAIVITHINRNALFFLILYLLWLNYWTNGTLFPLLNWLGIHLLSIKFLIDVEINRLQNMTHKKMAPLNEQT
jgi:hypothetical protein